jgi:hypothetical protein
MSSVIEVMARALAADLMGLVKDPYGARLPDDLFKEPLKRCERVLSALHSAGYQLAGPGECVVPVEPTEGMVDEGAKAADAADLKHMSYEHHVSVIWRAMLAASPRQAFQYQLAGPGECVVSLELLQDVCREAEDELSKDTWAALRAIINQRQAVLHQEDQEGGL